MITSYPTTTSPITSVDCQKQVRSWRFLRSLMKLLIPRCNCIFVEEENDDTKHIPYFKHNSSSSSSSSLTITGTIFGSRKGKVNFCIQSNPNSTNPILLLELALSTSSLAREMQKGIVRIALESKTNDYSSSSSSSASLLSMPIWRMYCNGKKVGLAVKRKPTKVNLQVLRQMQSIIVGAGIIHGKKGVVKKDNDNDDDLMYLRGKFERVHGFNDSESFHLVDPEENMGQELSIFFLRSLN
ncbi:protein MIZU-KUSSEI 1-like [Solanum pennellii]|uniref:Protein MIZU-KUSSEI 1-like n=1 Tax=Solanum pennellii TaxID=28526 RepID=A0ABM1GTU9_SOLPN|nr:protein MIZU-KUSSEI 1-like [Solanum pennellii]